MYHRPRNGLLWLWSVIVVPIAASVLSCVKSDANQPRAYTHSILRQLARTMVVVVTEGAKIIDGKEVLRDPKSLLSTAYNRGFVPPAEAEAREFEFDGWGNPLLWSSAKRSHDIVELRVFSAGQNGVSELGQGDDMQIELKINFVQRSVDVSGLGAKWNANGEIEPGWSIFGRSEEPVVPP